MERTLVFFLLIAAAGGAGASQHHESLPVLDVTISELADNPIFYNNAVVRVRGAAVSRFEAPFICESADDIDRNRRRCLALESVAQNGSLGPLDPTLYHHKVVVLTGVFDKDFGGSGGYRGALAPISVRAVGSHTKGDIPPPPPEPSANKSFKPNPLRGSA